MRIAMVFDGKNFYSGWRDKTGSTRIDFNKLARWIVTEIGGSEARLVGAYYYTGIETGPAAETESQKYLATFLSKVELLPGFFVRRFERKAKRSRCRHCDMEHVFTQEKEVDTTMVADMLRLAAVDAFDAIVLISGDADLTPAVEGVQSLGKQVYVASWGGTGLSKRIRKAAFDHIDLINGLKNATLPAAESQSTRSASLVLEKPERKTDNPSTTTPETGESVLLKELARAQVHFGNGFVGLHYFVNRWESQTLSSDIQIRSRILETLIKTGKVEKYNISGKIAIRVKT